MKVRLFSLYFLAVLLYPGQTPARGLTDEDLQRIGFDQHIGQQISPSLVFEDSAGRTVALGDLRNKNPTLLVLGYYRCPMLCTLINDGLIEALQELRFDVGRDFNVIDVSIDSQETPQVAAVKKKEYLRRYGRLGAAERWYFLTGKESPIAQLANEAGFRFRYDPTSRQYAHPSGFLVLTPDGRISRYFFGVNFEPKELRAALITASEGGRGSVIQQLVLLCSQYNPITSKYGPFVLTVVRAAGLISVLLLAWWIVRLSRGAPTEASSEGR